MKQRMPGNNKMPYGIVLPLTNLHIEVRQLTLLIPRGHHYRRPVTSTNNSKHAMNLGPVWNAIGVDTALSSR